MSSTMIVRLCLASSKVEVGLGTGSIVQLHPNFEWRRRICAKFAYKGQASEIELIKAYFCCSNERYRCIRAIGVGRAIGRGRCYGRHGGPGQNSIQAPNAVVKFDAGNIAEFEFGG